MWSAQPLIHKVITAKNKRNKAVQRSRQHRPRRVRIRYLSVVLEVVAVQLPGQMPANAVINSPMYPAMTSGSGISRSSHDVHADGSSHGADPRLLAAHSNMNSGTSTRLTATVASDLSLKELYSKLDGQVADLKSVEHSLPTDQYNTVLKVHQRALTMSINHTMDAVHKKKEPSLKSRRKYRYSHRRHMRNQMMALMAFDISKVDWL